MPNLITIPICYAQLSSYFVPTNKRGKVNIVNILIALVGLVLCVSLIPFIGAIEACVAFRVAEILQLIGFIILSKKDINRMKLLKISIKPLISSIIMLAFGILITYLTTQFVQNDLLICIILVISCSTIYLILLYFLKDELLIEQTKIILTKIKKGLKK